MSLIFLNSFLYFLFLFLSFLNNNNLLLYNKYVVVFLCLSTFLSIVFYVCKYWKWIMLFFCCWFCYWQVTAGTCLACFIAGLPMVCNGGVYLFTLLDWHTASWAILLIGIAEVSQFFLYLSLLYFLSFYSISYYFNFTFNIRYTYVFS